jgi:hypothetical protein
MALAADKPIHPNYVAHVAGEVLPGNTMIVSESFRNADHLMPFGLDKNQWRLVRSFGASSGTASGPRSERSSAPRTARACAASATAR